MISKVKGIQRSLEETYEWVKVLMQDYEFSNENKAFVLLRATLKAIRDRITPNEAVQLGTQLPVLLRGFYYEGWNYREGADTVKDAYDFLSLVRAHLGGHDDINLEEAVPAAMKLIFDMIDQNEAVQVKQNLPKDIQEMVVNLS